MTSFWHAFLPLFVAFDGIGLLPVFWTLTRPLTSSQRRRAVAEAVGTALLVAVGFAFVSRYILALMGLELTDVMIAGGVILIGLCLRELWMPETPPQGHYPSPGVVPLGVPLLTGPAVLTTVLLVRDQHGWPVTLLALAANLALIWVTLWASEGLMRRLGQEGTSVISKIFNLILTAFGVMLIRQGLTAFGRHPTFP